MSAPGQGPREVLEAWAAAVRTADVEPVADGGRRGRRRLRTRRPAGGPGRRGGVDVRLTVGLRREGGRWLITHGHHSLPAG